MAKKEDKYNVSLTLDLLITKDDGGQQRSWHDGNYKQKFFGMDYAQLMAMQQLIATLSQTLTDLGWGGAMALGFDLEEIEAAKKIAQGK